MLALAGQTTGNTHYLSVSRQLAHEPWQRILFSKADIADRREPTP